MSTPIEQFLQQQKGVTVDPSSGKSLGFGEGAIKSTFWSPLSLLGIQAPPNVEQWRSEHPLGGLASQLVGYGGPYVAWMKAAPKIPFVAKAMEKVASPDKLAAAPFLTGAKREFVRFLPFEVGRIAASATIADPLAEILGTSADSPFDVAKQAGLDLAFQTGIGGTFTKLASAGSRALKERYELPGVDLKQPFQLQLRQLVNSMESGAVPKTDEVLAGIERLKRNVRAEKGEKAFVETATGKKKAFRRYVTELDSGPAHAFNRLFKEKDTPGLNVSRVWRTAVGPFAAEGSIEAFAKRVGLGENFEAFVQYPRYITLKNDSARRVIGNTIQNYLKPLDTDKGWFFGRDKNDGLFVMAKRISEKEWALFKTDTPQRFVPDKAKYLESMEKVAASFKKDDVVMSELGEGAAVFDAGVKFYKTVPTIDYRGLDPRRGTTPEVVKSLLEKSGLQKVGPQGSALAEGAGNFARAYLAPGMFQFTKSPLAARAFNLAKAVRDAADGVAEKLFLGARGLSQQKGTLLHEIFRGGLPTTKDNIQALIHDVYKDPKQVEALWRTVTTQASIEEGIKRFGLDGTGLALAKALRTADDWQILGLNKVLQTVGKHTITPLENHYMLSRLWEGDWRVPIYKLGDKGEWKLMHLVGAKSKGGAEAKTKLILEAANARGIKVQARAPRLAGELEQDLARLRRLNAEDTKLFGQLQDDAFLRMNQPRRTIEERTGVHGFIGDVKPWTRDDLEHLVLKQFQDYQRFQARLSTEYILKNDLATLRAQDPQVYEQLIHRINSTYGIQGKFSQAINKATDKLLAPALGRNSADKITGTANKLMFRLELGFANMGYNLANLFTPALVAMPELVRLSTTHPSRNLMYYTYYPLIGEKTVKPLGIPDVFKIAREAFKKMGSPDEVLWKHFDRGAREGVWDPRFIEEFVGQKSQRVSALKGVLNGDEPFSRWLGSVSDAIPSLTEKFSRGYSFALGHTYFKNVMGITDDEALYQLSKQFVERTNFLYSIGDRARIITGPFGAPLGLFKNWIMHYISWMMEYTGEGVMRGNWAPLLWMTGTSTAIGGLGALPMYGAADTVSQWFTDKSAMQNLYSAFGGTTREGPGSLSDAVFYGIPGFLGFSIQNQVALPGSDPGQDAARMFSLAHYDRMNYLRKALGQAVDHWSATGESPVKDSRSMELILRAVAPKNIYRIGQVYEGEVLKSLTSGYPIISDMSPVERFMFGLGVNPRWVENAYNVSDELWKDQNKMKAAVSKYGTAWAEAQQGGDYEVMRQIVVRALYEGVDVSSIIRSAEARLAKIGQDMAERNYKPEKIQRYRELGLVQ